MTPKQTEALAALLTSRTKYEAAKAAGISHTTMTRYLADENFRAEYERAYASIIEDATRQVQRTISPAIALLEEIIANPEAGASIRVAAARTILEYGLRMTEFNDILRETTHAE